MKDIKIEIQKAIEETTERRNRVMRLIERHPESKRQEEKLQLDQKLMDLCTKLRQAEDGTLKQFGEPAKVGQETPAHIILKGFKVKYNHNYSKFDFETEIITPYTGFRYEKGSLNDRSVVILTNDRTNMLRLTDWNSSFPKFYDMNSNNLYELEEIANMFLNNKIDNLDQFKEKC